MRLRASDLTAIFEVYLLAVVLAALKNAFDAREPWFHETETLWVYATTFIGSLFLIGVMVLAALLLTRPLGTEYPLAAASANPAPNPGSGADAADEEAKGLLRSLEEAAEFGTAPGETVAETDDLSEIPALPGAVESAIGRRPRARRILISLLGPSLAAAFFGGISAALLPASGGLLQTLFTLNTFFVLVFAWGWAGLIPYAVASLFLASAES